MCFARKSKQAVLKHSERIAWCKICGPGLEITKRRLFVKVGSINARSCPIAWCFDPLPHTAMCLNYKFPSRSRPEPHSTHFTLRCSQNIPPCTHSLHRIPLNHKECTEIIFFLTSECNNSEQLRSRNSKSHRQSPGGQKSDGGRKKSTHNATIHSILA